MNNLHPVSEYGNILHVKEICQQGNLHIQQQHSPKQSINNDGASRGHSVRKEPSTFNESTEKTVISA